MALNPSSNIISRPDFTSALVGNAGDIIVQADDGTIATREFPGEDTTTVFEQDITENPVVAEFTDVGATQQLAGAVQSTDDKAFSVEVQWTDALGNAVWTEIGLDNIDSTDDYEIEINDVPVRSNSGRIRIVDESGSVEHTVAGVFNFA